MSDIARSKQVLYISISSVPTNLVKWLMVSGIRTDGRMPLFHRGKTSCFVASLAVRQLYEVALSLAVLSATVADKSALYFTQAGQAATASTALALSPWPGLLPPWPDLLETGCPTGPGGS